MTLIQGGTENGVHAYIVQKVARLSFNSSDGHQLYHGVHKLLAAVIGALNPKSN